MRVRGRNAAAAGLAELIDQLQFFLGFIGLAALLAGGLGVSTAVAAYLETRTSSIAVMKALGASGALVRNVYLLQVAVLAVLGVAIGVAAGAASPSAARPSRQGIRASERVLRKMYIVRVPFQMQVE